MKFFGIGLALYLAAFLWPIQASAALKVIQERTPFNASYVFAPNDGKAHPGIVLLHGSEGGVARGVWPHALLLAHRGFSVLTFCWYDCDRDMLTEPPPLMVNIELRDTVKAMEWFKKSKYVGAKKKLALYGISMGAEQALLLASLSGKLPVKIDAVVVHAPHDTLSKGWNRNWADGRCWVCKKEDLKSCEYKPEKWNPGCGKLFGDFENADPDNLPLWRLDGSLLEGDKRIEVEKYAGPMLVTQGDKDDFWPSDNARRIEAALKKAGRAPEVRTSSPTKSTAFRWRRNRRGRRW
jgi:dienelactone hydrolase